MSFFDKLRSGLKKTKTLITNQTDSIFRAFTGEINDDFFEELEEILILSDVGVSTTGHIIELLKKKIKDERIINGDKAKEALKEILAEMVTFEKNTLDLASAPSVILVMGVNGVGKTTSIAKIANYLKNSGKSVMLAAADTFRAAAADQLEIWANRIDVPLIKQSDGADPSAVVFDAVNAAKKRGTDVLIIDTAGRLHNKKNLMDELNKMNRIISRELPDSSRETLLVLDASTGQNAINQAKQFRESALITGLVVTKLDGTAKGGVVFSLKHELSLPVKFIGVGEGIDDLRPFDAQEFTEALFGKED